MKPRLLLYEQVQVLAMRDEDGAYHSDEFRQQLRYTLAGAVVFDLLALKYISLDGNKYCIVNSSQTESPDDIVLARALDRMQRAKAPLQVKVWVQKLYENVIIQQFAIKHLVEKGVLKRQKKRRWLVFSSVQYPVREPALKHEIIRRLGDALARNNSFPATQATLLLLGLTRSAGLVPYVFPQRYAADAEGLYADIAFALTKQPLAADMASTLVPLPSAEDEDDEYYDWFYSENYLDWDEYYDVFDTIDESVEFFNSGGTLDPELYEGYDDSLDSEQINEIDGWSDEGKSTWDSSDNISSYGSDDNDSSGGGWDSGSDDSSSDSGSSD